MTYFDCQIKGESYRTIFQYVFFKKFFAIIPKMHISVNNANASVNNANASVIEANDLVVKANDLIVETMN